ncbi:hypothetical protein BJV77DRAFT_296201 [Russula vinacea]|jgi:hypothetical protein|nr:hypothetical protein BJV77DRAFT_296201 [Russula vinacea]
MSSLKKLAKAGRARVKRRVQGRARRKTYESEMHGGILGGAMRARKGEKDWRAYCLQINVLPWWPGHRSITCRRVDQRSTRVRNPPRSSPQVFRIRTCSSRDPPTGARVCEEDGGRQPTLCGKMGLCLSDSTPFLVLKHLMACSLGTQPPAPS